MTHPHNIDFDKVAKGEIELPPMAARCQDLMQKTMRDFLNIHPNPTDKDIKEYTRVMSYTFDLGYRIINSSDELPASTNNESIQRN